MHINADSLIELALNQSLSAPSLHSIRIQSGNILLLGKKEIEVYNILSANLTLQLTTDSFRCVNVMLA